MKQIKLAFVLLTIMIVLGNCTFENRTTTTKMCLEDLDMNVQDTLKICLLILLAVILI